MAKNANFPVYLSMTNPVAVLIELHAGAAEREISAAWRAYQKTEMAGLDLGKICCEWRDKLKSKGGYNTKGKGLVQLLDELSIPRSTAYWWINRYELSIGVKTAKPEIEKPEVTSPWTPAGEKRANRSEPLDSEDAVIDLALRIIDAGYKALKGTVDASHLHAAVTLARTSLKATL